MATTMQRMGDGVMIAMTAAEVEKDIETATTEAAARAGVAPLAADEIAYLLDIYCSADRCVGVPVGREVVLSSDCSANRSMFGPLSGGGGAGIDCGPLAAAQIAERIQAYDLIDFGYGDYSFKPVKGVLPNVQVEMEAAALAMTVPATYGAQPNLGLYTTPDGPFPNPTELLNQGAVDEARAASEQIVEMAVQDLVYVGSAVYEAGVDGINFDTTGAYGDLDFLASLRASEILTKKYPGIGIEMGMAGEFIMGIHGELSYSGVRLAGLYPHRQVELAQQAGVTIFGPAVNINTQQSCAWNAAWVITYLKACVQNADIPVHNNMGMGVGAIPLSDYAPLDALTRASKACVEIARLDGL